MLFLLYSHKSRVKGHLRLKMTYLPKSNGSEEETTEQAEELEVGKCIFFAEKPSKHWSLATKGINHKMNVRNH